MSIENPGVRTTNRTRTPHNKFSILDSHFSILFSLIVSVAFAAAAGEPSLSTTAPIAIADVRRAEPIGFASDILPVLRKNCLACHNARQAEGDVVLETPEAMRKDGASGPVVVPGKSAESRLLAVAAHQTDPLMPPADNKVGAAALTPEQLGLIKLWIDQGAPGEAETVPRVVRRHPLAGGLQPILALAISPDDEFVACNRGQRIDVYHLPGMALACELIDPELAVAGQNAAHEDVIRSLAFDRTGDMLASGGFRTVKLWRRPRTTRQREIPLTQPARAIAASPDGRWLAIGAASGAIELYAAGQTQPAKSLAGHSGAITALTFSPDSKRLYSASTDATIRAWDAESAAVVGAVTFASEPRALAVVNAGSQLASGDANGTIHLWNVADLKAEPAPAMPARELKGHGQAVTALSTMGGSGERLLSGGEDGLLRLWNAATGETVRDFRHGAAITGIAVTADGGRVASAGADGICRVWNPETGETVCEIKGDPAPRMAVARAEAAMNYAQSCVAYRKEEQREADETVKRETATVEGAHKAKEQAEKTVGEKTQAATKAVAEREAAAAMAKSAADVAQDLTKKKDESQTAAETAEKAVAAATAALNQAREAAAKDSQNAELVAARDAAEKALAEAKTKKEAADAALNGAKTALAEAVRKQDETRRAAQQATDRAKQPERELQESKNVLQGAINFIPTATAVLERAKQAAPLAAQRVADAEALAAKQEAERKLLGEAAEKPSKPWRAMTFSADGARLALAGETGVRLFDAQRGAPLELLETSDAPPSTLAVAVDGRLLAAGERSAAWYEVGGAWRLERTIGGPTMPEQIIDRVLSLDFHPDGKLLATAGGLASRSGELKLWNVADGSLARAIDTGHRDTIQAVRFSPDGQYVASASADRLLKVFRVSDGSPVRQFEGHTNHVLGVTWRPDGKLLATCGGDRLVKLWNFETGAPLRSMRGDTYRLGEYRGEVTSISFIGETEHLVTSSGDKSVRMHRTSSERDVRAFREAVSFMHAAVATNDGRLVIGGGRDGVLHVWNGVSGYPVQAFPPPAAIASP